MIPAAPVDINQMQPMLPPVQPWLYGDPVGMITDQIGRNASPMPNSMGVPSQLQQPNPQVGAVLMQQVMRDGGI